MLLVFIAGIIIFVAATYLAIKAKNAGYLEDDNGNYIPDVVEDKAKELKDEISSRAEEVSKEVSDVGDAIKEVGKQASHIPGAVAGKRRAGKKK